MRFPVRLPVPTVLAGLTVLAGPLACLGSAVATGMTPTDATATGIQAEIDALRAEIDAYRAEGEGGSWADDARREEIRGIVSDVLADADGRVAFQDDSAIVGWKKGFRLQSPDGNFLLKIGGQMQIRWTWNNAKGQTPPATVGNPPQPVRAGDENLWGFENRRTKLIFEGHVVDPSWTYRIKGAFPRAGGVLFLEEAWVARKLDDGFKVKVGQFKAPWLRENLVSSSRQLTVDRSVVNAYFKQGYSQGIEVSWASDDFKVAGWTGDGIGSRGFGPARTNSQNTPWNQTSTAYSFAARGEWRLAGDWSQFKDFSSKRGSEFGAMVGVAGAIQRANQNIGAASGTVAGGVTADLTLDFDGASIFVAGVWTNVAAPSGGGTTNPYGLVVQGGYFVADDVEAFGRYSYMDYDLTNVPNEGVSTYNGFTVGANWFINAAVKVTVDWSINFDSLATGAFVAGSAGFRPDVAGESDQWAFRGQLQLLF